MARRVTKRAAVEPPERETAQIQVYVQPELLEWLDTDRVACQEEIRADMGKQQTVSRSAHVVAILHQYRITKEASDAADGPPGLRAFWRELRKASDLRELPHGSQPKKRAKVKS